MKSQSIHWRSQKFPILRVFVLFVCLVEFREFIYTFLLALDSIHLSAAVLTVSPVFDRFPPRWNIHALYALHVSQNEGYSFFCAFLIEYSFDQLSVQCYMNISRVVHFIIIFLTPPPSLSIFSPHGSSIVFLFDKWNATRSKSAALVPRIKSSLMRRRRLLPASHSVQFCVLLHFPYGMWRVAQYCRHDGTSLRAVEIDTNSVIFWNFQCIRHSLGIVLGFGALSALLAHENQMKCHGKMSLSFKRKHFIIIISLLLLLAHDNDRSARIFSPARYLFTVWKANVCLNI